MYMYVFLCRNCHKLHFLCYHYLLSNRKCSFGCARHHTACNKYRVKCKGIADGELPCFAVSWVNNTDTYLWPLQLFLQTCAWLCLSFADSWAHRVKIFSIFLSQAFFFPSLSTSFLSCCFDAGLCHWDSTCFSFFVLPGRDWGNSYSEVGRSVLLIKNNWSLFN